jgi:hypothetical protein
LFDFATEYALRRMIHRSTQLQDRGQVEELAALFARGEIVLGGVGQVFRGVEGVRTLLRRNLFYDANGQPADPARVYATGRALHYLSNVDVFLDEGGAPAAESLFLILQQHGGSPHIVVGGRYVDSFGRDEGSFYFRRRMVEVHLVGDTADYLTTHPWTP